jgi:ABC-type lipoprotein export system ATPase subunit
VDCQVESKIVEAEKEIGLNLRGIEQVFRGRDGAVQAVGGVDLRLKPGDFTVVRGASGCGKTTLLLMAGALLRPTAGVVELAGQDVYSLSGEARAAFRARRIGFVFQQFYLIPYLSVLENVLAVELADSGGTGDELRNRALALLTDLQMGARLRHVPGELSTGEQQRTALARAMVGEPALILADEPTGNLDPENGDIVLSRLRKFADEGGMVLMVTHDERAERYAGSVIKMEEGRLL